MSRLTLQVHAPQPNALLMPGDVITVTGVAAGFRGAEPVSIDSVTVALAGVQVDATLKRVPRPAVLTKQFEANLTVPAVVGIQQVVVAAVGDNQETVEVDVPVVVRTPVVPMPWANSQLAAPGSLPAGARLTAIAKPVGCELWWIGTDGAVNGFWSEPGTAWSSYQLAGPGSAAAAGGISAISKGGDVMEVWWIGFDGSVQATYHDGYWLPYTLAGAGSASLSGGISGIWKGGDVMEAWWIGPDGSVQAAYHEGEWRTYTLAGAGSAS
ncbi:MAG: hypothetical protein FIA96_17065, partial [Betaproteobacteria bacterium]|nr:hypothetical protein [Betaproteobacteria bacterium]